MSQSPSRHDLQLLERSNGDRARNGMAFVLGGTFRTGSDHRYRDETRPHPVSVDSFLIGETAVTNAELRLFVRRSLPPPLTLAASRKKIGAHDGITRGKVN